MFPDSAPYTARSQRGFLLPVAVFVLVVMSVFAISLWHSTNQTSLSIVQELLSTQAFYAAESGAQSGAGQLFAGGGNRTQADAACTGMSFTLNFSVTGLNGCSADVSCSVDSGTEHSVYVIDSEGQCGTGQQAAQRTVRVDAFLSDEE